MEGVVKEVMVGGNFRVEVEGGHNVLAQLAGNMRRNRIRVVLGDSVTVAVSPYDPTRGLIVFRAKWPPGSPLLGLRHVGRLLQEALDDRLPRDEHVGRSVLLDVVVAA